MHLGISRRWAGCWRAGNWKQSRLIGLISPSGEFTRQMDWRQLAGDFDTVLGVMGQFSFLYFVHLCLICHPSIHFPPFVQIRVEPISAYPSACDLEISLIIVCWRLSHIVEQKRRLVRGATVVYCKTCFFLSWCVNEESYTSVTYKLSSNWESTQKMRVFFHIEEEITALQRKQLCRINLIVIAFK